MPLGISLPPGGLSFAEDLAFAREAEERGYESCWVAEVAGNDAFALGAAVAAVTKRLRIGTAVVPMGIRGPALLAMSAATLQAVSGGRAVCGIGVSSPQIVEAWNDRPYDRPLQRARETVEVLRRLFAGERVDYQGRCLRVRGYRMIPPPPSPVPIYLGALNPRMLRLGGAICDGVVVNMFGERFAPQVVAEVRRGAEEAGRQAADVEIVMRVQCVVGEDPAVARDAFAAAFAPYIVAPGYDRFFAWQGYGDAVEAVRKAMAVRDRAAARAAIPGRMLEEIVVAGDAATVRARLQALQDAGITTLAVHCFWPAPEAAWRTMRALAPG